jgi:RNA polymerase sigma-70 factor (ECF subfamily)
MLRTHKDDPDAQLLFLSECKLTNEELIRGIVAGNRTAARQFHLRYSARISRSVWRILGGDRDHEDLVQQVLVGVIAGMPGVQKPDSLDAWVKSVTIRTVRDELRKRRKSRIVRSSPGLILI